MHAHLFQFLVNATAYRKLLLCSLHAGLISIVTGLYLSVKGSQPHLRAMTDDIFNLLIWCFGDYAISRWASTTQDASVCLGFAADVRWRPRLDTNVSPRNSVLTPTGPQSRPRPLRPCPAQKMDPAIK